MSGHRPFGRCVKQAPYRQRFTDVKNVEDKLLVDRRIPFIYMDKNRSEFTLFLRFSSGLSKITKKYNPYNQLLSLDKGPFLLWCCVVCIHN
jgi:hypothetical protein